MQELIGAEPERVEHAGVERVGRAVELRRDQVVETAAQPNSAVDQLVREAPLYADLLRVRLANSRATALAAADDPDAMARAMRYAVRAGRLAFRAGRMPAREIAVPSSPSRGMLD